MRILLFSDLHADGEAARALAARAHEFDVLVGAGDFANARRRIEVAIAPFRSLRVPIVFVAGNNETPDELRKACEGAAHIRVLHGEECHINGEAFFGLGGAVPITPFGSWSFDVEEDEAARLLEKCPVGAILVSHSPPLGVLDQSSAGKSLGSKSVARCIADKKPKLLVCGHIHASSGRSQRVGQTLVVNAGPGGMEWRE
ncbi:serine/threonine protein phosphatase [bacterium]|nr:MAG: serine/threonine protein phosphatase [bacterium]